MEGEEEHGEGDPGQRTNERRGPRSRDRSPPIAAHLVPEDVLGRQERVLQDADEVDDGALLYPALELETKVHTKVRNHGEGHSSSDYEPSCGPSFQALSCTRPWRG